MSTIDPFRRREQALENRFFSKMDRNVTGANGTNSAKLGIPFPSGSRVGCRAKPSPMPQ